ncbi:hypothetical protein [Streptomyces chartreusis]|uniref:hypothetical protein n=1 Tax=Streptomyces chartreusis TaxID=1969 RepID=UPI0036348565
MSLDQELATAPDVPAVFLAPARRHSELHADILAAATASGQTDIDPYAYLTQPTILRRLAADLAGALPAGCDRLITQAPAGLPLAAAVSLHTGLPFAALDMETAHLHGEVHQGESVAVIHPGAPGTPAALAVAAAATARGAGVSTVLTVLADDTPGPADPAGPPVQALFDIRSTGHGPA